MFLTLKNEKTLKKMRSKTLKNNIFFILGRNLIIRSFEIPHSIWKLHKDFKSVFVFKFRQKTKKFTPKWQKPLFEKRVMGFVKCFTPVRFPKISILPEKNAWIVTIFGNKLRIMYFYGNFHRNNNFVCAPLVGGSDKSDKDLFENLWYDLKKLLW